MKVHLVYQKHITPEQSQYYIEAIGIAPEEIVGVEGKCTYEIVDFPVSGQLKPHQKLSRVVNMIKENHPGTSPVSITAIIGYGCAKKSITWENPIFRRIEKERQLLNNAINIATEMKIADETDIVFRAAVILLILIQNPKGSLYRLSKITGYSKGEIYTFFNNWSDSGIWINGRFELEESKDEFDFFFRINISSLVWGRIYPKNHIAALGQK